MFPQRNTFPPKVVESYTMNAFKKELGTFCSPTNCGLFRGIWSVGTVSPLPRWLTDEGSTSGDPQHLDTESWIRCQATVAVRYSQSFGDQKQNSVYMHLQLTIGATLPGQWPLLRYQVPTLRPLSWGREAAELTGNLCFTSYGKLIFAPIGPSPLWPGPHASEQPSEQAQSS